jgi:hypothetical protein
MVLLFIYFLLDLNELRISLIQVGSDPKVAKFLKAVDEQLESVGAKFDICDIVQLTDFAGKTLSDVLLSTIID